MQKTKVSLPALTEKDIRDAKFAIENKVDWIALSFVRTSQDLEDLQDLIAEHSDHKIQKSHLRHFEEIHCRLPRSAHFHDPHPCLV